MLRFFVTALFALALGLAPASAHMRFHVYVEGSDVSDNDNSPASPTNVTGLFWPAHLGIPVWFRCKLMVTSALITSGVQFQITGPAMTSTIIMSEYYPTTATKTVQALNALATLTTVSATPTTPTITTLEGMLLSSAAGTYQVQVEPTTDTHTATVKIGSVCEYAYEY